MADDWYEEPWAIPVFVVFGYTLYKVFTEKPLRPTTAPEPVTSSAPVPAPTLIPSVERYALYASPELPEPGTYRR